MLLNRHKHIATSDILGPVNGRHPDPSLFFEALVSMSNGGEWESACHENIDVERLKRVVTDPTNWEWVPPEMIGTVVGTSCQRVLGPAQFATIFKAAGVSDHSQFKFFTKNVEIRYSDGKHGHAIPFWHLDYDVWNPPQYDVLTVSFSDDPHGGTHYLDIPKFKPTAIDKMIESQSPGDSMTRLEISESIQSLIEELTRQDTSPQWLNHYTRYCEPGTIYRNLTKTHFHKSPPLSHVRVLFVVGVPHAFRDQGI